VSFLDGFLERKIVVKIVSILLAILLWYIVLDIKDPFEEATLTVPLQTNVNILDSKGLELVGNNIPDNVEITVSGRKSRLEKVFKNDFYISADFLQIEDEHTSYISIGAPKYKGTEGIIIKGVNPEKINIRLEKVVTDSFEIMPEIVGELPENYSIHQIKVRPEILELKDIKSSIDSIDRIVAEVDLSKVKDYSYVSPRMVFYNKEGKAVSGIDINQAIIVELVMAKNVAVNLNTSGQVAEGYYVNDIQHNPEYINVIGEMQVLNKLYTINTNPVDLQGLKDDVKLQSDFQLPENIKLANLQEKETISVDIEPFVTKRFTYSVDKISIYNADQENYTYKIKSTTLSGDATGRLEDVNLFIINPRIKAWINVNNLIEGTHKVDVNTASQNTDIEVVTENSVEVIVEEIRNDDENHSLDNINTNLNTNPTPNPKPNTGSSSGTNPKPSTNPNPSPSISPKPSPNPSPSISQKPSPNPSPSISPKPNINPSTSSDPDATPESNSGTSINTMKDESGEIWSI